MSNLTRLMRCDGFIRRWRFGLAACFVVLVGDLQANEAAQLTESQIRATNALNRQIRSSISRGEFAAATKPAKEVHEVYTKTLGTEHWMTRDANVMLQLSQTFKDSSLDRQQDFCAVWKRLGETTNPKIALAVRLANLKECDEKLKMLLGSKHPLVAANKLQRAAALRTVGRFEIASEMATQAGQIFEQNHGEQYPGIANAEQTLGLCALHQAHHEQAVKNFRKAVTIFSKTIGETHAQTLKAKSHLGHSLTLSNKRQEAFAILRKVLTETESRFGPKHPETMKAYLFLGANLQSAGELNKAERLIRKATSLATKHLGKDNAFVGTCLSHLAICLREQNRYQAAEQMFREALRIYRLRKGDTNRQTITTFWNLASILFHQYKYVESEQVLEQLIGLQNKAGRDVDFRMSLRANELLTACHQRLGKPADSKHYEQLLRKDIRSTEQYAGKHSLRNAKSHARLGLFLSDEARHEEAARVLASGLEICRTAVGEYHAETISFYQQQGQNLFRLGKTIEAEKSLAAAADRFEATRFSHGLAGLNRATDFSTNHRNLPLLAILLAKQDRFEDAFERLEQGKARGLLDDLANRRLTTQTANDDKALAESQQELKALDQQIAALAARPPSDSPNTQMSSLLRRHAATVAQSKNGRVELAREYGVVAGEVYNLARIQSQIPADTALVTWSGAWWQRHESGEFWACVVRQSGPPKWIRLNGSGENGSFSRSDLDLADRAMKSILTPNEVAESWDSTSIDALAKSRVAPLEPYLAKTDRLSKVKHLVVVFPSPTHIPVEVLTDDYTVSYAPSATIYAWLREQDNKHPIASKRLLAVGDPEFRQRGELLAVSDAPRVNQAENPARLPGTRVEIESIGRLFGEATSKLLGKSANALEIQKLVVSDQLREFRYLHFATHGEANHRFQSALILADASIPNDEQPLSLQTPLDSRLTAAEILEHWNLNADLVTLSACDTGLGSRVRGEHFVGFSQAFLLAGARSVLVSMWPVRDDATSLLMRRFYQNLLGKRDGLDAPLCKSEALREAKTWLRQLTANELDDLLEGLPPTLRSTIRERRSAQTVRTVRPFEHPYFWAPFILIGAPGR